MVALPISGLFADEIGWESVFYFFGTLGAFWFVFWTIFCYDTPSTHPRILEVHTKEIDISYYKFRNSNSVKKPSSTFNT